MTDTNCLKVMFIFEAGSRLHCGAEVLGLACHLYHRFFNVKDNHLLTQYDMHMFGSACIQLAHWFYEKPINVDSIALVLNSIQNGHNKEISVQNRKKLAKTIEFTSKIIANHLDYQINYKDTKMLTPGENFGAQKSNDEAQTMIDLTYDEYEDDQEDEMIMLKNSKHTISSHRYLVHYLNTIKLIIPTESDTKFKKICNISWTYLSDFHWSPHVTRHYSNHLACTTLMMAIETFEPMFSEDKEFWKLINKKWNLIFCDDFDTTKYERLRNVIIGDYKEYERILQHEFLIYVIDPQEKTQS